MTMNLLAAGELIRDPERKTASNGNAYVSALLKVDADTVVGLTCFDAALAECLAGLRKGAALACRGRLQARPYTDKEGALRAGLSVVVGELIPAPSPCRCWRCSPPKPRGERSDRPAVAAGEPFDDDLPAGM